MEPVKRYALDQNKKHLAQMAQPVVTTGMTLLALTAAGVAAGVAADCGIVWQKTAAGHEI